MVLLFFPSFSPVFPLFSLFLPSFSPIFPLFSSFSPFFRDSPLFSLLFHFFPNISEQKCPKLFGKSWIRAVAAYIPVTPGVVVLSFVVASPSPRDNVSIRSLVSQSNARKWSEEMFEEKLANRRRDRAQ